MIIFGFWYLVQIKAVFKFNLKLLIIQNALYFFKSLS